MKLVFFFSLFLITNYVFSQNPSIDWVLKGGGTGSDKASNIEVDANGFTYVTGFYNETANFGPINCPLNDENSKEVFIAKIDPTGNYVWVRYGKNHYDDRGLGMHLDENGNVYVTGTCWGGIEFDGTYASLPSQYTDNIFLVKYDNNGVLQYVKMVGTDSGDDHGHDIKTDQLGNLYLTGFISNYSFGPGGNATSTFGTVNVPVTSDSLAFLAKMDPTGNWLWVKTFDGEDLQKENRLAIDDENNLYVAGGFHGTNRTFGADIISSIGEIDLFVVKYDQNGNHIWTRNTGSTLSDRIDGICFGADKMLYVTGEFRDSIPFGNDTLKNNGGPSGKDIFVARLSKSGEWKWAKKAGSNSGSDRGISICSNSQHNIFVTGQYRGNAKFGGSIEISSLTDSVQVFVAAIDTLGKWRWALSGGTLNEDRGTGIIADNNCNVYSVGYFDGAYVFDTTGILSSIGKKDAFVQKIKSACFGYDESETPPVGEEVVFAENNVFTPNGDATNDEFNFVVSNSIKNNSVVVVNRWGNIVYESDDVTKSWNGKNQKGILVEDGVYFYQLHLETSLKKEFHKQGFISIYN